MSSSLCFIKAKQTDVLNEMGLTYDGTLTNKRYYFTAKMIVKVRIMGIKSSHWMCSMKKAIFKNFAIFTGKHLFWSLFLIKLHAWRKKTQVFRVDIVKFLRKPTLKNIFKWQLLVNSWHQQCSYFHTDVLYISFTFILKHLSCIKILKISVKLFKFRIENLWLQENY